MKATTFRLIDAINREGLDNSRWGVIKDCESTRQYFGTHLDKKLHGQYIYIHTKDGDIYPFIMKTAIVPDEICFIDWANQIWFYKI